MLVYYSTWLVYYNMRMSIGMRYTCLISFPLATRSEVSEAVLLRDIIFVFQGIEGEVLRYDIKQEAYRIDEKVSVAPSVRELCHKLAELGWIYRRVRNFIDSKSRDKNLGLVCQVGGGWGRRRS